MRLSKGWLLLVGAWSCCATIAFAEPNQRDPLSVLGDGSRVSGPAETHRPVLPADDDRREGVVPSLHDHVSLGLPRLGAHEELEDDPYLSHVTLYRPIAGSLILKYRGLQGFVVKQLRRRYRRVWRKQIRALDKATNITTFEVRDLNDEMGEAFADHSTHGRWWDRAWYHSLPADKGGAPAHPYVHQIGEQVPMFKLGPLSVTNDFRVRVDKVIALSLGADPRRLYRSLQEADQEPTSARDFARLNRYEAEEEEEAERSEKGLEPGKLRPLEPSVDIVLDVAERASPFWEGVHWRLKFRPGLKLRVRTDEIKSSVYARLVLQVYLGSSKRHIANIECKVRYRPLDNEAQTTLKVSLLTW